MINPRQRNELIDALLECPSMVTAGTRNSIVGDLSDQIQSAIQRSSSDRDDVANIVRTCLNYANGLEELIAGVRNYEHDSVPMGQVDRLLLHLFEFPVESEELGLGLLTISGGVDTPLDRLREFYRSLLPPGATPQVEPLGLFAMLGHLWQLSSRPGALTAQRTFPIVDFAAQLAMAAGGRRIAGELKAWADEAQQSLYQAGPGEASTAAPLAPGAPADGPGQIILAEAARRDRVKALVDAALAGQSGNPWLLLARRELRSARRPATRRAGPSETASFERILPAPPWPRALSFLEQALERARPVARVTLAENKGTSTAFLTHSNLLIMPSFVVATVEAARQVTVQFNFQRTAGELYAASEELRLAPDEVFTTSEENMWTAVRVQGDPNARWGALDLLSAEPKIGDLVSMIHHAFGGPKQVELLHGVVLETIDGRIRYTFTQWQGGSGGGPVFDANWGVIGMHVSVGPPTQGGTSTWQYREGIHINTIVAGLKAVGLYVQQEVH